MTHQLGISLRILLVASAAAGSIGSRASAQYRPDICRVFSVGDVIPSPPGGTITGVLAVGVDDSGVISVIATTNTPAATILLRADGTSTLQAGNTVQVQNLGGGTSTATLEALSNVLDTDQVGRSVYVGRIATMGTNNDSVGRDDWIFATAGGPVLTDASRKYVGQPSIACAGGAGVATSSYAVMSAMTELIAGGTPRNILERGQYAASGFLTSSVPTIAIQGGMFGADTFQDFGSNREALSVAPNGRCIFYASLIGPGTGTAVLEYDPASGMVEELARESSAAGTGFTWRSLSLAAMDNNSAGTWACVAGWMPGVADNRLTRAGPAGSASATPVSLIAEDNPAPGFPPNWDIYHIRKSTIHVGEDGNIVIVAQTIDRAAPGRFTGEGLYAVEPGAPTLQLLLRDGDPVPGGALTSFPITRSQIHVSDNGRFIVFVAGAGGSVGVFVIDLTSSSAPFCLGDGSGTPCPCGNTSPMSAMAGCTHSLGVAGTLRTSGVASLTNDSLTLCGASMPSSSALYFQGTAQQSGGLGSVFGDGLRCAGGTVVRLSTKQNVLGTSAFPAPGDPPISVQGLVGSPGSRTYQCWYRNAATFCTVSTFNLTNGLNVAWLP